MPIPPSTYGALEIKIRESLLPRTMLSGKISALFRPHPAMFEIRSRIGVSRLARAGNWRGCRIGLVLALLVTASCAQETSQTSKPPESPSVNSATSGQLVIWCVHPEGCSSRCAERSAAFQALSSPDIYNPWDLYQDRLLCGARSSDEFAIGMGGWVLWFRRTPRLQSSGEHHSELIHLARSRDSWMGAAL